MQSKKYLKTKTKLQAAYQRASNIQNDLMQKFTTMLVDNYDSIVIEDLDVKKMMMSHVASKGMHRSMFGKFRQVLSYKCEWYGKKLIVANKLYPSTQRCAVCGLVKKKVMKRSPFTVIKSTALNITNLFVIIQTALTIIKRLIVTKTPCST